MHPVRAVILKALALMETIVNRDDLDKCPNNITLSLGRNVFESSLARAARSSLS